MGVDHCGSDVLMSEKLLHCANVIPGFEHIGGPAQCGINSGVAADAPASRNVEVAQSYSRPGGAVETDAAPIGNSNF
jgi:hypothetical protein